MRLDLFLVENGLCDSRTDAKNFIISGNVTVDGKIITAAGMGVALEFGLALVSLLCGKEKADGLRKAVIAD